MISRIKNWWRGEFQASSLKSIFDEDAPDAHFDRPFLARTWVVVAAFWQKEWKWIIATIIGLAAIWGQLLF